MAMLGIAVVVLAAFVGLSYRQWQNYRRANAEAERNRETLDAIDSVLGALEEADRAERGYLLTGEVRYLQPYDRALQELPNDLATLNRLAGGNRIGNRDTGELATLVNRKLDELRQTIEMRRTRGLAPAADLVLSEQVTHTLGSIRVLCQQMQRDVNANQVHASQAREAAAGIALLVTVAGSLMLLFFFAFGFEPFASPDPTAWQRSWLVRYGAAVLAVVAITLIRAALSPIMGPMAMPFTMYFCAVMFAAWFGGFRPAVLATLLSLLAGDWFFAEPTRTLMVKGHDDQVAMLVLVLVGFGTALLSRGQRSAVDRALHAENSERNERKRFEATLASIGDAVIATDADGRITLMNGVAESLTGWSLKEAQGKPLSEAFCIVNQETRQPAENPVEKVRRLNQVVGLANHTILIARSGQEFAIDDSGAPIFGPDGSLAGVVLVFRDVTEARKAEDRLTEQAALLEQAWDAIIVFDEPGSIKYWNSAAERLYGWSREEAVGKVTHDLLLTKFPASLAEIVERIRKDRHWQGELIHTCKDGTQVTVLSRWAVLSGDDSPDLGPLLEINTDITERKRAEGELSRERERLSLALATGKMGAYEMDLFQNALWLSPESYSFLGTTPENLPASPEWFVKLVHPRDRQLLLQHIKESIEAHEPINHEFRIVCPDGKDCWLNCQGVIEYDEPGRAVRHSGLLVDITLRKESEQMLRRFERLSAAARLSAAMAHEINNPLACVINLIYLAKTAPGSSDASIHLLTQAEAELERVAHAARQTLGFYRESNAPERVELSAVIESVLELYSTKLIARHISIERAFCGCAPVEGVRGEIRQAVSNVIANAIEAVDKGGVIIIGINSVSEDEGGGAEIVVADDGPGVSPEDVNRVFEPFFTTKGGTGMGLGLWVAKDIIERHGGTISVKTRAEGSELRGATFTIRLPRTTRVLTNEPKAPSAAPTNESESSILDLGDKGERLA